MPHRTPRTAAASLGAAFLLACGSLLALAPAALAAQADPPVPDATDSPAAQPSEGGGGSGGWTGGGSGGESGGGSGGGGWSGGGGSDHPTSGANGADISISPEEVAPGGTVGLVVNCSARSFGTPSPTLVSSMAFVTSVRLHPMPGQPGLFSGSATISQDVKPGEYSVSGACQERNTSRSTFRGTIEVHGRQDDHHPHGPVHTGVGGSIDPGSTTQVAIGLGLAGAAGGALLLGRRRGGAA
ncbi:hypothetical protein [Streptacidiphilus melanogenes]|uniref:hypothetical protein n=1 Tax=Streptacidiphilus melanogenes TaxID=411235 RepID=UPI0014705501|nr:hypothetical protein [Streptacidiphilus melanogenes]